jgi:hypothetical protein
MKDSCKETERNKYHKKRGVPMRFPKTDAEIIALAEKIIAGMSENPNFPSPPISASELRNLLDTAKQSQNAQIASQAVTKQATDTKQEDFDKLEDGMKLFLRYAEGACNYDNSILAQVGWGTKSAPHPLEAPGQPQLLEVSQEGLSWLVLSWKQPVEGGAIASYKIERRERAEGDWMLVDVALDTEIRLENQERGKEWEYRIIAINKAGKSAPSNIVMAVL